MSTQPQPSTLVHDVAISVGLDLQEAIAAYEVYRPSASGVDFEAFRTDYNQGFMVVRASLYRIVLLALCRIWDQGRSDRYSLKKLFELLENPEVRKVYEQQGSFEAEKVQALRSKYKKALVSEELKSIKAVRDSWIAHTASRARIAEQEVRPTYYGDELKLIEMSAPIIFEAAALVKCALVPISNNREIWSRQGINFWACVLNRKLTSS